MKSMTALTSIGILIFVSLVSCRQVGLPRFTPTPATLPSPSQPTLTSTYSATPTFAAIQSLAPEDASARVSEYLTNNPNCQLPCWLGITPGQSTLEEIQTQLTVFNNISTSSLYGFAADPWVMAGIKVPFSDSNSVIEVSTTYLSRHDDNVVSVIGFQTDAYALENGNCHGDLYGYAPYDLLLKPYMLSGILSQYGVPTQVFIRSDLDGAPSPGWWGYFDIHLWYPERGIFMEYRMVADGSGNTFDFCPAESFISGTLLQPGLGTRYQNTLLDLKGIYPLFFPPASNVKTPEDAFGITAEELYQQFRSPTDRCLETPKSIWWQQ